MKKINKITRKFRRFSSSDSRRGTMGSGAGTNFEVGVGGSTRRAGKKKFVVPVHFFGSTSTISRFGERFRDCQYSLVSFLFAVLLLICKGGGMCPRALWSRSHWHHTTLRCIWPMDRPDSLQSSNLTRNSLSCFELSVLFRHQH